MTLIEPPKIIQHNLCLWISKPINDGTNAMLKKPAWLRCMHILSYTVQMKATLP